MNPSTSSTPAAASSSSWWPFPPYFSPQPPPPPPPQGQKMQPKGAHACLQALKAAAALLPLAIDGLSHLLGGAEVPEGQDDAAAATHILQTLRRTLDDLLGDGGDSESAKRKRVGPAGDNTHSAAQVTACAQVLQSKPGHLLTTIVGWLFHERHTLPSRVALGQVAFVSKEWCYISRQACFWRPLVGALLPSVGANEDRGRKGYFDCLSTYGKCLAESHVVTGESGLFEGLELQIEVWNGGALPLRIFSAVGPIRATIEAADNQPSIIILHITGPHRKEVPGPAFSANDLDPMHRRYSSIADCIESSHDLANPLHLCMRVTVTDRLTGKMALVWSSMGKNTTYTLEDCADWVQEYLPGESYYIRSAGWTRLYRRDRNQQENILVYVGFPLNLLPGQENIDEIDKKHIVGVAPSYHDSFGQVIFKTGEAQTVATFLRSLLE